MLAKLPPVLRAAHRASLRWDEFSVRKLRGPHSFRPGRPTVVGFLRSTIGIGALARFHVDALRALGCSVAKIDIGATFGLKPTLDEEDTSRPEPVDPTGPIFLHMNPPELPRSLRTIGVSALRDRWMIGCWNWELPDLDPEWRRGFQFVDEVWVPSSFTADALRPHSPVSVRVVTPPIPPPSPPTRLRAELGLPDDAVVFLTAFDMRSTMERKNPIGAIHAFRRAMGSSRGALLIVKVSHAEEAPRHFALLRAAMAGAPNVRLLARALTQQGMNDLLHACDAVLSLHRAEGFGLLLAEAIRRGRCVIATDWSGSRDFLHSANSLPVPYTLHPVRDDQGLYRSRAGRAWAEPDLDEAVDRIRSVATQHDLRERIGMQAQRDAEAFFSLDGYAKVASPALRTSLEGARNGADRTADW